MKEGNRLAKKDMKWLSRRELIEVIYQLKLNEQELHKEIDTLRLQLQQQELKVEDVGSIAEAALSLSGIYEAAQKTADIYLEEIKKKYAQADRKCDAIIADAQKQADMLIQSANDERKNILTQVRAAQGELQRIQTMIHLQKD